AGEALGVGGHLSALRRTRVGSHGVEGALPLERLEDPEAVRAALLSPAEAVSHLPRMVVDAAGVARVGHGGKLAAPADDLPEGSPSALLDEAGALIAIAERRGADVLPRKVLG